MHQAPTSLKAITIKFITIISCSPFFVIHSDKLNSLEGVGGGEAKPIISSNVFGIGAHDEDGLHLIAMGHADILAVLAHEQHLRFGTLLLVGNPIECLRLDSRLLAIAIDQCTEITKVCACHAQSAQFRLDATEDHNANI